MISQMNAVQNAARLAMADHRAAAPLMRRGRRRATGPHHGLPAVAAVLAVIVLLVAITAAG